jgi:multidrug efflux pump subunit AcrA (membrane-fusion protein)
MSAVGCCSKPIEAARLPDEPALAGDSDRVYLMMRLHRPLATHGEGSDRMAKDQSSKTGLAAPHSWRRRLLIVPPIILGVAALAYATLNRKPPEQTPPSEIARHVRVITVKPVDVLPRTAGFGTVRPANIWNAVAQVSGKVTYVHPDFKKGAILNNGTEIIGIDATDYKLAIAEAEANIRSAEAKLVELKVTETNLGATLKVEQASLKLKQAQLKRKRDLLRRGALAQASVDEEERASLTQQQRVIEIENQLRLLPTQRAVQREQIAVQKSKLETAKLNLSRTRIRMPFRGRIAEVSVEATQFVQVGTKLGVADDIHVAEIEAQFRLAQMASFGSAFGSGRRPQNGFQNIAKLTKASGVYAVVRLRAGERRIEWKGDIVRVSDTVDEQTRTIGIVAAVTGSYEKMVPGLRPPLTKGMFVEVELRAPPVSGRIVVPRSALHDGKLFIANAKSRLEIRPVKAGLVIGSIVIVNAGLKAGERVVVSDISPAVAGMLLKTTEDGALVADLAAEAAGKERAR